MEFFWLDRMIPQIKVKTKDAPAKICQVSDELAAILVTQGKSLDSSRVKNICEIPKPSQASHPYPRVINNKTVQTEMTLPEIFMIVLLKRGWENYAGYSIRLINLSTL